MCALVCAYVCVVCVFTVPVRKKFPTVEYFFYGTTLSTYNTKRTTLLRVARGYGAARNTSLRELRVVPAQLRAMCSKYVLIRVHCEWHGDDG